MNFSIIIPTYNRPQRIRECLDSISKLNYPLDQFEVVLVDDGSHPPLSDSLRPSSYPFQLSILRQPNGGPGPARNLAVSHASGTWLAFTDDDCQVDPNWLHAYEQGLLQDGEVLLGGFTRNVCSDNIFAEANQFLLEIIDHWFTFRLPELLFFTTNNIACSRKKFIALGGFNPDISIAAAEDRDFGMRWHRDGGVLRRWPSAIIRHCHPQNLLGFSELHFRYGKGAAVLQSLTHYRTRSHTRLGLYLQFLTAPFRHYPLPTALCIAPLLLWSQVCLVLGVAYQSIRSR